MPYRFGLGLAEAERPAWLQYARWLYDSQGCGLGTGMLWQPQLFDTAQDGDTGYNAIPCLAERRCHPSLLAQEKGKGAVQ